MSSATKCDRCGAYYEDGGKNISQSWGREYDLCPDCAESFDAWMEYQPVTDATERVTNDGEMLHDTREQLVSEPQATKKPNSQFDAPKTAETAENATSKNEIHNFDDSREQLEADVRKHYAYSATTLMYPPSANKTTDMLSALPVDTVIGWLDRQAAITEREFFETACQGCERLGGDDDDTLGELKAERNELAQRIQALEREIATLKEHRAGNVAKLHELTDECAELRKWKGLAEKYRADSIAAQEETERYRAKLGAVLDAIHDAEEAAR